MLSHTGIRHSAVDPWKERENVYELVQDADVFLENLRPGLAGSEGYSPGEMAEFRPGIVYGSSGYERRNHLRRLPTEYYRGDAVVHWTMTISPL